MEINDQIFADSNFFVALFNPSDTLHQKAQGIARILDKQHTRLVISNFILLEVATVLSQKRGKIAAIEGGEYLQTSPTIKILHIDEAMNNETWQTFRRVKDKNISFVDCSIIVLMKAEHITRLLTFDATDFRKLRNEYRFTFAYESRTS